MKDSNSALRVGRQVFAKSSQAFPTSTTYCTTVELHFRTGWPPLRVVKHQSRCGCDCRLFPKGPDLVCFVRCRWYCQWTLVSSVKLGNLVFTHALKGLVWRCRHVRSICRVRSYSRPVYQPPRSVSDDGNDKRRMIDDIYTFPWTTKS